MDYKKNLCFILLSLIIFVGVLGVVSATNYYVTTTGNDANDCLSTGTACLTIQGAISKASATDTVNIATGTYAENVVINKALTLNGANSGVSGDGTRGTESNIVGYVKINAGNVIIDGFKFTNGAQVPAGELSAIYIVGGHSDFEIKNNLFVRHGAAPTEFDKSRGIINEFGGVNSIRITDNKFTGWHTGIYLQKARTATINNNIMDSNMVGTSCDGPFSVTVTNNTFSNNAFEGVGIGPATPYGPNDFSYILRNNKLISNKMAVSNYIAGFTINAKYNWWGTEEGDVIATLVFGNVNYDPWLYKPIEELFLPDTEKPTIGDPIIVPQYPNCNYGTINNQILVQSEITDLNKIHHARFNWRFEGSDYNKFMQPLGEYDNLWKTTIALPPEKIKNGVLVEYQISATDNAGNERTKGYYNLFRYDCLSPTTTESGTSSLWTNQNVIVILTCNPGTGSPCNKTYYSTSGLIPPITPYSSPFTLSETGEYQLTYYSTDLAGNIENTVTGTLVRIDKEIPTISDDYSLSGIWTNLDQTVTLDPQDTGGSGIKEVKYCTESSCNPSAGTLLPSPYQLYYSTSQDTTVRYQAWDNANNPSVVGEFNVKLDKIVPITSDDYDFNNVWKNSNQVISLSVSNDGNSPINWTRYCLTSGCNPLEGTDYTGSVTISIEGTTYFRYASADTAGNVEETKEKIVKIDKTLPTVWINGDLPLVWQTSLVDLNVECLDELSGCDGSSHLMKEVPEITTDCSTVDYSGGILPLPATIISHVYLCARATDNAGNYGYSNLTEVLIDTENPFVNITSPNDGYNLTGDIEIFVNATDYLSGIGSVIFELRNSTDILRSGSLIYDSASGKYKGMLTNALEIPVGTYILEVKATDNVGNENMDSITLHAIEYVLPVVVPLISSVPFGQNSTVEFEINFIIRGGNAIRMKMTDLSNGAVYTPEQLNARLVYAEVEYPVRNDYTGAEIVLESTPGGATGTAVFKMDIKSYMVPGNYHADYQFEISEV